jgi:hypothetical protein
MDYKLKNTLAAFFRSIGESLNTGESVDQYFDKRTSHMDDFKQLLADQDFEIISVEPSKNRILIKIAIFTENEDYQNAWIRLVDLENSYKIYSISHREIDRSVLDQDEEIGLGIEREKPKSLIADLLLEDDDPNGTFQNC